MSLFYSIISTMATVNPVFLGQNLKYNVSCTKKTAETFHVFAQGQLGQPKSVEALSDVASKCPLVTFADVSQN